MQGVHVDLGLQTKHHEIIVSRITVKLGIEQARERLNRCLYYLNIGSDDYINNYFMPEFYHSSRLYNPEQYADALIAQYRSYLQVLYIS